MQCIECIPSLRRRVIAEFLKEEKLRNASNFEVQILPEFCTWSVAIYEGVLWDFRTWLEIDLTKETDMILVILIPNFKFQSLSTLKLTDQASR